MNSISFSDLTDETIYNKSSNNLLSNRLEILILKINDQNESIQQSFEKINQKIDNIEKSINEINNKFQVLFENSDQLC
jgi:hypothetical protein